MKNERRAELRRWSAQGVLSDANVRECLDELDAVAEFARVLDPENADNDPLGTIQGAHIANRNAIRLQRERAEAAQRDTDLLTEYGRALAQPSEPGSPGEAAFVKVVERVQERAHELGTEAPEPLDRPFDVNDRLTWLRGRIQWLRQQPNAQLREDAKQFEWLLGLLEKS